jgi:hypothetical protein
MPPAAVQNLGDLEADIGTCAHVAGPVAVRVFQLSEKANLELAFSSALWAGVGGEIVEAYHHGYVAALGFQSRDVIFRDMFRNKSAAVAQHTMPSPTASTVLRRAAEELLCQLSRRAD